MKYLLKSKIVILFLLFVVSFLYMLFCLMVNDSMLLYGFLGKSGIFILPFIVSSFLFFAALFKVNKNGEKVYKDKWVFSASITAGIIFILWMVAPYLLLLGCSLRINYFSDLNSYINNISVKNVSNQKFHWYNHEQGSKQLRFFRENNLSYVILDNTKVGTIRLIFPSENDFAIIKGKQNFLKIYFYNCFLDIHMN